MILTDLFLGGRAMRNTIEGALVNVSRNPEHWWVILFPGLLIFITVSCYNLVGEAFRDAVDPRLKD